VAVMKMFDKVKVNVNLLIYLLNKKFYGKWHTCRDFTGCFICKKGVCLVFLFLNMIEITAYKRVIFFLRPKLFGRMYPCAFLLIWYYSRMTHKMN
jgi:hypothetical protein